VTVALADILAAIERDGAAEVARIGAAAEAEAGAAARRAEAEGAELEARLARARDGEVAREAARLGIEARKDAARALRRAREAACARAIAAARRLLAEARWRPAYRAIFRALALEAAAALPDASVMRVDPRDAAIAAAIAPEVAPRARIDASLETAGGLELATDDGREARNTLEERLLRAEPLLRRIAMGAIEREREVEPCPTASSTATPA
jgi:vacuolar-type H+-ATPase subunit E/Vma4